MVETAAKFEFTYGDPLLFVNSRKTLWMSSALILCLPSCRGDRTMCNNLLFCEWHRDGYKCAWWQQLSSCLARNGVIENRFVAVRLENHRFSSLFPDAVFCFPWLFCFFVLLQVVSSNTRTDMVNMITASLPSNPTVCAHFIGVRQGILKTRGLKTCGFKSLLPKKIESTLVWQKKTEDIEDQVILSFSYHFPCTCQLQEYPGRHCNLSAAQCDIEYSELDPLEHS